MSTYESIVENMKTDFMEKTGYSPDEASDIGIRIRVLAGELYNINTYLEWIKRQVFPQTAEGEYLDYHAQLRGLKRKQSVKAVGDVEFKLSEPATEKVDIPANTVVLTGGEHPISFQTTEYAYIDVGRSFVVVPATAVIGGEKGNVAKNQISVISTMTIDGLSVTNNGVFATGANAEDDETLRTRILNSMKFIVNGTNKEYYSALAKTISGVECVNVVPRKNGAGTVMVYISGREMELGILTVLNVQTLMDKAREVNVTVTVKAAELLYCNLEIEVLLENGYTAEEVQKDVYAKIKEITDKLDVGESLLLAVVNDILYHTEGIKEYVILNLASSGYTARENQKIVLKNVYLREDL
ncbi:MAG: baseplate J/gp47 family protein [Acutalibacteraceae bacterium]|nr:baseplate J/gp47 family protein [Acutalibacteraceae bacterium]